jgi:hypothetical protein
LWRHLIWRVFFGWHCHLKWTHRQLKIEFQYFGGKTYTWFLIFGAVTDRRLDGDTSYHGVIPEPPQMYHDTFGVVRWYAQKHPHNLSCGYGGKKIRIMIPIFFWWERP